MEKIVNIQMFGSFSISESGIEEAPINIGGRARRIWSIIAYLILHRDRDVTVTELIDMLWPDDEERVDPVKTLQHNMSRARDVLGKLGISDARELIQSKNGSYRWNPQRQVSLDAENFIELANCAAHESDEDRAVELRLQAAALYRGDFLAGLESESWVIPTAAFYRSAYLELCGALTTALWERSRWSDIVAVCELALRFAPENEELAVYFIRSLTALGHADRAVSAYKSTVYVLGERLGVLPCSELELAHEQAVQALAKKEIDITSVQDILQEKDFDGSAMFCDWSAFLALVRQEARSATRRERHTVILTAKLGECSNEALESRRMEQTLAHNLRSGDVFARLNARQFLAMLPEAGNDNMDVIIERLRRYHARRYPTSESEISFTWYALSYPEISAT